MEKISGLLKNKLVKNGFWLLVLEGFNCILPFLTVPYITRILSPDKYGVFSIGLSWISYLQILVIYGFDLSATRKLALSKNEDEQRRIYSKVIGARVFLVTVSIIILIGLLLVVGVSSEVKLCMIILFTMVIGNSIEHNWIFKGKEEVKIITFVNVICRTITTILIFILVRSVSDIYLYCVLYSINYLLAGILGSILVRKRYKIHLIKIKFKDVIDELKDGFVLFLSSAMVKLFSGFGVIYLGIVASEQVVGIYSALIKIPTLIVMLWGAIAQVIYPAISKVFAISYTEGLSKLKKIATPILLVAGIGLLVISVCNKFIVGLVFGEQYLADSIVLIVMCLWVFTGILNNFLGTQALIGSGHSKRYTVSFLISLICNLTMTVIFTHSWGLYGVAFANLISEIILTLILLPQVFYLKKQLA